MKKYPLKPSSLKYIDIEQWLADYFVPIDAGEYNDVFLVILTKYLNLVSNSKDPLVKLVGFTHCSTPYIISRYLLKIIQLSRLSELDYECILGDESAKPNELLKSLKANPDLSFLTQNTKALNQVKPVEMIKRYYHLIKRNIYSYDVKNWINLKNFKNRCYFVGNKKQKEVLFFSQYSQNYPVYLPLKIFMKRKLNVLIPQSTNESLRSFLKEFLDDVEKNNRQYFDGKTIDFMFDQLYQLFSQTIKFILYHQKYLKKMVQNPLYATHLGIPLVRSFCAAWKYAGGKVIGFSHGNVYSTCYVPVRVVDGHLNIFDEYISNSKGEKFLLEENIKDFDFGAKVKTKISYTPNNHYKNMFDQHKQYPLVKKVKSVMIIGFFMFDSIYEWFPEHHFHSHIKVEIETIKKLKQKGYRVIYKPHPETYHKIEGIFDEYADEIKTDNFEKIAHLTDCLLFTYSDTTTFGNALLTNRPIVVFNVEGRYWHQDSLELVKKRCAIIQAKAEQGSIVFRDEDLYEAVELAPDLMDDQIIKEFAF